jgi:hypothetical protein
VDQKISEILLHEQRNNFEKESTALKDLKLKKGKSASIFDLKNKIVGKKKMEQEATVLKDPTNNQEVTDPEEIKKVSLNYCTWLLKNREPKDKFKEDVDLKRKIHEKRMNEFLKDDIVFSEEMFQKSLKDLKQKKSNKYNFILKSGKSHKIALFRLFETVWNYENEPEQWRDTNIRVTLFQQKLPKLAVQKICHYLV